MVWFRDLYAGKSIAHKKDKIKNNISRGTRQKNIYMITLAANPKNLLEIIPSKHLSQKAYPKDNLFVVGLAKGADEARDLACDLVMEIYEKTGEFRVREHILKRQEAEDTGGVRA